MDESTPHSEATTPVQGSASQASRRRRLPRWALLVGFWAAQAAVIYVVAGIWIFLGMSTDSTMPLGELPAFEEVLDASTDRSYILVVGVYIGVITLLQGLLVLPVRRPRAIRERGASLWFGFAAAGLTIAGLWLGMVLAGLALVQYVWTGQVELFEWIDASWGVRPWMVMATLLLGWAVATPLLIAFCRRGRRETMLARLSTRILQGTAIEVVAVIPLDVMVRRRTDCYCDSGTFWALTLCGTAGAVVAGPAIMLPVLARRRRRWYAGRCEVCGYDMGGLRNADRCPECGSGWQESKVDGERPSAGGVGGSDESDMKDGAASPPPKDAAP